MLTRRLKWTKEAESEVIDSLSELITAAHAADPTTPEGLLKVTLPMHHARTILYLLKLGKERG